MYDFGMAVFEGSCLSACLSLFLYWPTSVCDRCVPRNAVIYRASLYVLTEQVRLLFHLVINMGLIVDRDEFAGDMYYDLFLPSCVQTLGCSILYLCFDWLSG